MIGGMDTVFPVLSGATAVDFCARLISQSWPGCVFVLDDDPAIRTHHGQLALQSNSEVIVYRDRSACDAWDELGYDESLRGTMIYLIAEPKRLTLVTEHDPSPPITRLVNDISAGLPSAFPLCDESSDRLPSEAA